MEAPIPVILFSYARPIHLAKVLGCLRENGVSLIYTFADGAKGSSDAPAVGEVRRLLRAINWAEVRITERTENLGLGRNVLAGVSEVSAQHQAFIVWEDDLICVPGTYAWMCSALHHYASDERVMSVTAWTHPRIRPLDANGPYFDRRAECWVWGAYARAWKGMDQTALEKMKECRQRGFAPDSYGADLPPMARIEQSRNIWAVRWLYHHFQNCGLCLRPPHSMVEHMGFDDTATNAPESLGWMNSNLQTAAVPPVWPSPVENPDCRRLWRAANPPPPSLIRRIWKKLSGR